MHGMLNRYDFGLPKYKLVRKAFYERAVPGFIRILNNHTIILIIGNAFNA